MSQKMDRISKVGELVRNNCWNWPRNWNDRFDEIMDVQVPIIREDVEDKTACVNKKGK